jgi:hypothetical protein
MGCPGIICCRGQVVIPVRPAEAPNTAATFATILAWLRANAARAPLPRFPLYERREHTGGAPPDWATELVPRQW